MTADYLQTTQYFTQRYWTDISFPFFTLVPTLVPTEGRTFYIFSENRNFDVAMECRIIIVETEDRTFNVN